MICGSVELRRTSERLFFLGGIFMMEQRHAVRGREQGPSDLIGMESQSWLIKNASYC